MRQIDADKVKIEIEKQIAYCDEKSKNQSNMEEVLRYANTSYGLRLANNYIDNAPTVKTYCYYCGQTEHGKIVPDALQGWRYEEKQKDDMYKCPKCSYYGHTHFNFTCPNCGADMRGNKETTFDDYLKEQLKDPEFRKEWEKLSDEEEEEL